jgi:hypothetical protein
MHFSPGRLRRHFWLLIAGDRDWITDDLKLHFIAEMPLPSCVFEQVVLVSAEERTEYC